MSDRDRYFEEATSWALETRAREARSARLAWIMAGVLAGIAMLEAVALALLTPLKTVQPVTVLVDRQTGFVETLDPQAPRRVQADAALTTSMLAQYVTAREGFDRATVANDYKRVALWSTGPARARYLAIMPASNPISPLQRNPNGMVVAARVKSVSPLSPRVALVRFDTQQQDRAGRAGRVQPWVAVVRYQYSDAGMTFENRLLNPLGFQVTSYRRDPEAPVGDPPPAATAPTASATPYRASVEPGPPAYPEPNRQRIISSNQLPMGSPLDPRQNTARGRVEFYVQR